MKKIIIFGAGPAGLTAAYELSKNKDFQITILEESNEIGGLSRTVNYKGNHLDLGGHRFFSKNDEIMDWWTSILPIQEESEEKEADEEKGSKYQQRDQVMFIRKRISRIYFSKKFFEYPLSINFKTLKNLGFKRTFEIGASYIKSTLFKRDEKNLEDFMINRFGKVLYRMFFEKYTEKVWGKHPSEISSQWGNQRIKGLSIFRLILDFFKRSFLKKEDLRQKEKETSLIEKFIYPKYGPGQMWRTVAEKFQQEGGKILIGCKVIKIQMTKNTVSSILYIKDEEQYFMEGDLFISSIPICELVSGMEKNIVPKEVLKIAAGLEYRDFITVGILLKKNYIKNGNLSDCWIYIQESEFKVGRIQIFNNWSPYMVKDNKNTQWIGMEYFANEGDDLWSLSEKEFISFAEGELCKLWNIDKSQIIDAVVVKVKKAYPAYFGSYSKFEKVRNYLDSISNLYCVGRNGQHRYNNMDHSMLTAMEAAKNIQSGRVDKENIWAVNTEEGYHENK